MLSRAALLSVCLSVVPTAAQAQSSAPASPLQQDDLKAEFDKRLKEAEGSVDKLWKVHEWCEANGRDKDGRAVLRAILKLDDGQRKAHELLGEKEYDGKWFANDKKLEEYKQKQLEEEAKKQGKVVYKGELVDPADLPLLQKGMKKLDGKWVSAEEYKRRSEGWLQHDLEWVPPAESENIKKGLFKCGELWLDLAEADKYHSQLDKWWRVPSDHFVVYSTCKREIVLKAAAEAERAIRDFSKVVGKAPEAKVAILVLNSGEQYNEFAGTRGVELRPFSSLHGATMAEVWVDPFQDEVSTSSAAVCYWDSSSTEKAAFGPFFTRHAAGLSLIEAMDPSPKTLAALAGGKAGGAPDKAWYDEKKFPEWFRYGAASYVERYIVDSGVKAGGDALWMRKWALQNIANKGGIDKIDEILAMGLTLNDVQKSAKLINEAGLLVSFVIDGKCTPVIEKHAALKDAIRNGKDTKAPFKALEEALKKNEEELRKFAGI